ncbi:MAG: nucleotidyltransferase [Acidimicrobiia bacterium]|nr:nucleotidyltransferase [Acidimicrobiia bacterium]
MTDWESTIQVWVKPPSDAEETRRDRTEAEIRQALDDYKPIPNAVMRVFAQGSYKNKTNVRLKSDVDIAVELQEEETTPTTTPRIATSTRIGTAKNRTKAELGLTDKGSFDPKGFKDHVEEAMVAAFGQKQVERRNKAIRIHPGSTTLPADVVPCVPHRLYDSQLDVHRGIRIFPDSGIAIENYPQQHYDNGVSKNMDTSRRYKRMVRAFKRMAHHLSDDPDEPVIPGFTIECLLFNVPNSMYSSDSYLDRFKAIGKHVWYQTFDRERCEQWLEVSELKYIFRGSPDDKRKAASDFMWNAWKEVGG